ncbi:hypothetical protein BH10ACT7_BH10ACT7_27630 [soil metagenome]
MNIQHRSIRRLSTLAIAATLLTLGVATPATAALPPQYPMDHGIYYLETNQNGFPQRLQETGQAYFTTSAARIVVASPSSWGTPQQQWRVIEDSKNVYRFLNVDSGRALQKTGDDNGIGAVNVATTPAAWRTSEQFWYGRDVDAQGTQKRLQNANPPQDRTYLQVNPVSYNGYEGVTWTQAGVLGSTTDTVWTFVPTGLTR